MITCNQTCRSQLTIATSGPQPLPGLSANTNSGSRNRNTIPAIATCIAARIRRCVSSSVHRAIQSAGTSTITTATASPTSHRDPSTSTPRHSGIPTTSAATINAAHHPIPSRENASCGTTPHSTTHPR